MHGVVGKSEAADNLLRPARNYLPFYGPHQLFSFIEIALLASNY